MDDVSEWYEENWLRYIESAMYRYNRQALHHDNYNKACTVCIIREIASNASGVALQDMPQVNPQRNDNINIKTKHNKIVSLFMEYTVPRLYLRRNPRIEDHVWRCSNLTLNVRGPSYLGLTRSIPWLLMPWLLTSQGHQQPWYWLCIICRFWSYLRKNLKYLCHINVA